MSDAQGLDSRRQAALRVLLPLGGVLLIVGALASIALYGYQANRRGALDLTESLLTDLQSRIGREVEIFFLSSERAVRLSRELFVGQDVRGERRETLEHFGQAMLRELPQVSLFMAADAQGNYLAVRHRREGGFTSFIIRNSPGPRRLTQRSFDPNGRLLGEEEQPENNFDPRTRPWYIEATQDDDEAWTELYRFFTDRMIGVTVATAIRRPPSPEPTGVIALDISLRSLSAFLASLEIARNGRAVIIDRNGRVVAYPDFAVTMRTAPDGETPLRLDELGDPVLARAYDRTRLEGDFRSVETVDGQRHIIMTTSLQDQAVAGWRLLVAVPESDFTGFVDTNSRRVLVMALGVVAFVLVLALLLIRQGLRADRAARHLLRERASIASQSAAFSELAGSPALFDPGSPLPPELTERMARVTGAARACIWRLSPDGRSLTLEDSFDSDRMGHTGDARLLREEMPAFFSRLASGEPILVEDAATKPETAALHRAWLSPLGTRSVLAVPIQHGARNLGVVWVEDARHASGGLQFLGAVASLLAVRAAGGAGKLAERAAAVHALEPEASKPESTTSFVDTALCAALGSEILADVYPQAAVMVLRFTDPLALGGRRGGGTTGTLFERLAHGLERAAGQSGIPYLRVLGTQVVAATGLGPEADPAPANEIADFALAARKLCTTLFEEAGGEPAFRIGMDLGIAFGGRVGPGEGFLNLWGEAVTLAGHMADSAPLGGIQVTAALYGAVSGQFLFRPRGAFLMPRHGRKASYVLAAAL
ncbi:cache domain-containing protein [Roseococcus sp. YIM B11640]|uniref:cache domain-containing protein n=1 Tax=Roseococcus sp. YIM B11640 TaxID=3133973 RepID=UPI003C79A16A